ncbi:hypothetical protein GZH53_13705 [Flavihumibacter sp. R14]|nr:hypothetical protein [Flavihumibacter soli]
MNSSAFTLGEEINNRKIRYVLYSNLWDKFIYPDIDLDFSKWRSIKYLNSDESDLNDDIATIPRNIGGLYLFYVKCKIITGMTEFPFYIGRAQLTSGQNLQKRVKEYFQKFAKDDERPKITRMIRYWGADLYLAYYPLPENEHIINVERDIINSLLLPMNDLIPDKQTKQAIKAFDI